MSEKLPMHMILGLNADTSLVFILLQAKVDFSSAHDVTITPVQWLSYKIDISILCSCPFNIHLNMFSGQNILKCMKSKYFAMNSECLKLALLSYLLTLLRKYNILITCNSRDFYRGRKG